MAEAPNSDDRVAKTATEEEINVIVEGDEAPKDKRANDRDDDEDQRDDDQNAGEDEEKREQIRAARRAERHERKKNREMAIQRDREEYAEVKRQNRLLEERLAALEGRTVQQDARQIDERLAQTQRQRDEAERVYADAISKGDGQLAMRAQRVYNESLATERDLKNVKSRISQPQQRQPQVDPRVARYAEEWASDNSWYDPSGNDPDSRIVQAIDAKLAAEGLDPSTPDYWDALDENAERALPHRYKQQTGRKSPPVSGGRDGQPSTNSVRTFVVSKARREAMEAAGIWDDPVKRQKQIRAFMEYDKNSRR